MKRELIRLLQNLIKIDSQNPPGNNKEIISFIRNYLREIGVFSKMFEFKRNSLNLVCRINSKKHYKKILFTPHVDTVPAVGEWRFHPFSGKVYKGKIYGRGATDCKVNVAVSLYLIKKLKEENVKLNNLDLVFAFCGDEETGSKFGIIPLMRYLKNIDYGVVLDADEFSIVVAQKGVLHLRVEIFGKESHGAYPERGVNAVEKSVNILREIMKHKFSYKVHPLLKKPTLNIGKFVGGEKVNIVPDFAFFELDIRYLPSMSEGRILKSIERIVKKQKVKYKMKILAHQKPLEINKNSFLIKVLKNALKENRIKPMLVPSFGATVVNFLIDRGIDSFAFGFGTKKQAHTKNEYVKIDNLYKGVGVLKSYVKELDSYLK
jgi:succinyl-diaminopimelate desuccinylase